MEHINIEEFSNGELSQQINREILAVMNNIADPNTEAKAARKITVTIGFKANEQRDFITTSVNTVSKLAPTLGAVTALGLAKNLKTGEVEYAEIGKGVPGQMSMNDLLPSAQTTVIDGKHVDTETGEIVEPSGNVVDLRKIKEA